MRTNHELSFQGITLTGKAAKFRSLGGSWLYLPLSQIEFDYRAAEGETVDVDMPEWLAREKGLE